jgi:CHAT domain-containing protein
MQIFYRNIGSHPETKLDALRDAQLSLLYGGPAGHFPLGDASAACGTPSTPGAAPFAFDEKKPFAHPFYWAPFFMMGNWL